MVNSEQFIVYQSLDPLNPQILEPFFPINWEKTKILDLVR
jgi:hypothetical protein